jgi:aspartyl-tRNA(Asn)/glutamyl-tRNA(Gln) amidotransferase subunit B
MEFETVIGLEVHVELKTESKIFSSSPNHFGAEPNTNTSVIDLGYPGVLPVLNKKAVEFGIKAAMAINCEVATHTKFDRKNYFYPDNPKAYQISQFDKPIGEHGYIDIEVNGYTKRIGITRIHLEEDAGKLNHGKGYSLCDYNRQGTPLVEIVSEPDIRTPDEAGVVIAGRILNKVSECSEPHITVSCGVSYWKKERNDTYQSLFKRADEALYVAKETGKNKVVIQGDAIMAG